MLRVAAVLILAQIPLHTSLISRPPATSRPLSPPPLSSTAPRLCRRHILSVLPVLPFLPLLAATPARAGLGPSAGAIQSGVPAKQLTLEQLLQLPVKKRIQLQRQLVGRLGERQAEALLQELALAADIEQPQLDELIEGLETELAPTIQVVRRIEELKAEKQRQADSAELASQLRKRNELLAALAAQPAWVVYGAAVVASTLSTCVMHPIDTVKTRAMAQGEPGEPERQQTPQSVKQLFGVSAYERLEQGDLQGCMVAFEEAEAAVAVLEASKKETHSSEPEQEEQWAILGLYEGLGANVLKEGPSGAVYLGIYELVKSKLFLSPYSSAPLLIYLLAGAAGETVASALRAPSEAVKTRLQSEGGGLQEAVRDMLMKREGQSNLLNSWLASLVRDVPFGAVQLAVYEGVKIYILSAPEIDFDVGSMQAEVLLGGLGGCTGAILSCPADVLVTRLNTQSGSEGRLGVVGMSSKILEEGGAKAFFKGWRSRCLYWTPAIGIFLASYCSLRQYALTQGL